MNQKYIPSNRNNLIDEVEQRKKGMIEVLEDHFLNTKIIIYCVRQKSMISQTEILEYGDIYFFYRPKVRSEQVKSIDDLRRFFMITALEVKRTIFTDYFL